MPSAPVRDGRSETGFARVFGAARFFADSDAVTIASGACEYGLMKSGKPTETVGKSGSSGSGGR